MKTVFENRQVAHVWAAQSQDEGRGSNFFFEGPVIYSYGRHFPIAVFTPFRLNGERVVVFNSRTYSTTTSKHQNYTHAALTGHAVVRLSAELNDGTARELGKGTQFGLRALIESLADAARAEFADAIKRRDPHRIAWGFGQVASRIAAVHALCDLVTKEERKATFACIGTLPTLPESPWMVDGELQEATLKEHAKQARENAKREAARVKLRDTLGQLSHAWKCARGPHIGDKLKESTRHEHATNAAELRERAEREARAAGDTLPRNVPAVATIARLVAKLAPLAAVDSVRANLDEMRRSFRAHALAFYTARRDANVRETWDVRALIQGGYFRAPSARYARESVTLRGLHELSAMLPGIAAGTAPALEKTWPALTAYAKRNADARALQSEFIATAQAFNEWVNGALRVAYAWRDRDYLADRAEFARNARAVVDASGDNATARDLSAYIGAVETHENARRDYLETNPTHSAEPLPDLATLDTWRARLVTAERFAQLIQCERKASDAADKMREAGEALERSHVFHAARALSDAIAANGTARVMLDNAREGLRLQDEPADSPTVARARRVADSVRLVDENAAELRERIARREEDMRAELGYTGDALSVHVWRLGDQRAPRPTFTAFRLTASGDVESSLGAQVTQRAARRLWALIRAVVASGTARRWGYAEGPRVGAFHLESIAADGATKVGCHNITAAEARAFARFMQWPPFGDSIASLDALPDLSDVETFDAAEWNPVTE